MSHISSKFDHWTIWHAAAFWGGLALAMAAIIGSYE